MAPGLDEKRLGNPIKPGEEIAETEPKPDHAGAFQPWPEPVVPRVAAVEQPDERAESDEQHGPDMQRRKGEHRERAEQHREQRAARACEAGDPSGGARCMPPGLHQSGEAGPAMAASAVVSASPALCAAHGCAAS